MKPTREANSNSVHLDSGKSESAGAPGECGSVPDGSDHLRLSTSGYSLRVGWGDQKRTVAASPRPLHELAPAAQQQWLDDAERLCDAWNRRSSMQPPNNQPNSDHVAVISAEPGSSLTTDQIIDTALSYGHPVEELFVGFFKRELVTYIRRLEKISQENKSGISSPTYRPNEKESLYPCGYHQCEGCNICSQEEKQ